MAVDAGKRRAAAFVVWPHSSANPDGASRAPLSPSTHRAHGPPIRALRPYVPPVVAALHGITVSPQPKGFRTMTTVQRQLTAGDLMTIDPVVVAVDAPLQEAERLIRDYRVSGLPVIDRDGMLVGVISQTDFVHLDNPEVRALIRNTSSRIPVGEVMSRPPVTVLLTTPLLKAARLMLDERVHRVVVIDHEQRPL